MSDPSVRRLKRPVAGWMKEAERQFVEQLKNYRFAVSSSDFPGTVSLSSAKGGRNPDVNFVQGLADKWASTCHVQKNKGK